MILHDPCPVVPDHWPSGVSCLLPRGHEELRGGEAHLPSIQLAPPSRVRHPPIPTQEVPEQVTLTENHKTDPRGYPLGGSTTGPGIEILWNEGQLVQDGERRPQTGAFAIDLLRAARGRIAFVQTTQLACVENDEVMSMLDKTIEVLQSRPKDKGDVGVETPHGQR